MKAYMIVHRIFSGVQAGVQGAHALAEMMESARLGTPGVRATAHQWVNHEKTLICLNGGSSRDLKELIGILQSPNNPYPWGYFCESQDFAEGIITAVAVILPSETIEDAVLVDLAPDIYYHVKDKIRNLRLAQ